MELECIGDVTTKSRLMWFDHVGKKSNKHGYGGWAG